MKTKSIRYNFIIRSASMALSVLVSLIVYPYVTRVIFAEGIGKVNFAQSVIYYFTMIAQLGAPTYGIRECAKLRDDYDRLSKTVQEILIINIVTCLISYLLFFLCLFNIEQMQSERQLFLIMSSSTLLLTLGVEWVYIGLEKYTFQALLSLLFKVAMVIGVFSLIHTADDYIWYGAMYVLGSAGFGLVNFCCLGKFINLRPYANYELKKHLKPILMFFAMTVAVTIYTQMDSVMLGFMRGTLENGYYDSAVKVKIILTSALTALGTVVMPRAAYHLKNGDEGMFCTLARRAMQFVMTASVPLCVYFILFAKPVILVLSGEGFLPSVAPMRLIMPTLVLISMSNILGVQMMVPLGKDRQIMWAEVGGAAVNLVVNTLLIPSLGASGAAIGTVVAELTVFLVMAAVMKSYLKDLFASVRFAKIVLGVLLSSLASVWLLKTGLSAIWILVISAVLYFGVYGLLFYSDIKGELVK